MNNKSLPIIGWREWISLPDLGIEAIKVKVDSGARSSSLHAKNIHEFEKFGEKWVKFQIYPVQRRSNLKVETEAPLLEYRHVRSSSGKSSLRPVIITNIKLSGVLLPIEITLTSRDEMGFRMLLGREAFRNRFLVDAGKSYYGGKPEKKKSKG
ncbi:MAG: ATP-dependent zinc protease [Spirochaetales bacterium]|nr:ATP-dependent zinc protease [Spirochaetales bacterium]